MSKVLVVYGTSSGCTQGIAEKIGAANADALKGTPVAMFTCGLAMHDGKADETRAYSKPVEEASGITPVDVGLFAGWNEPKKMSFPERTVLKMMKAPEGDFRDFAAVEAWADEVAPQLGLAS